MLKEIGIDEALRLMVHEDRDDVILIRRYEAACTLSVADLMGALTHGGTLYVDDGEPDEAAEPEPYPDEMIDEPEEPEELPKGEVMDAVDSLDRMVNGEKKAKRSKLDEGKMLALYRAGWSAAKIADEMGCSDQTIYNRIKKI